MKFWKAMQKVSEQQAIRFKQANYYLIIKDNKLIAKSMDDDLPVNRIDSYGLDEDGWELYQVTHDFNWAKEQMERGSVVRRTSWPNEKDYPYTYIAKNSIGQICKFFMGSGMDNTYALTIDDLNAKNWIRYE